jgi:hypothetical protein
MPFQAVADGIRFALIAACPDCNLRFNVEAMPMTFKIERLVGKEDATVLRVCGRVQIECVETLRELIEAENTGTVLDLLEVTLADGEAATFFAFCELEGTELRNCPAFLRGWVDTEKARIAQ